ncbi:hypothetical protein ACIQVO_00480 [Streptomyces sp. NPDC101062]|uniref:hypothetical protein n=1 Tax=unclassified Streptomyces TaxID=2593676 RepID=UPI00381BE669
MLAVAVERNRKRGVLPRTGDAHGLALALSWMAERSIYMLFSRHHTPEEEDQLLSTLTHVCRRGVGETITP